MSFLHARALGALLASGRAHHSGNRRSALCERSIAAHGRTVKRRGNGSEHLAAARAQQPERIVQYQITQEVCQVIGMLGIEPITAPIGQHR